MVELLVFIVVEPKLLDSIGKALREIAGVKEVISITGEFDIIARIEAPDLESALKIVKERILTIEGVRKTITSIVVEKY